MSNTIRSGLIAGAAGLVLTVCISFIVGICGPLASLSAGILAGVLSARGQTAITRGNGAREGAVAGGIAGALSLVGQLIGGLTYLLLMPSIIAQSGGELPFGGQLPAQGDAVQQGVYFGSGLGTAFCIGMVGVVLAAGAAAAVAYFMTPDQPAAPPPPAASVPPAV